MKPLWIVLAVGPDWHSAYLFPVVQSVVLRDGEKEDVMKETRIPIEFECPECHDKPYTRCHDDVIGTYEYTHHNARVELADNKPVAPAVPQEPTCLCGGYVSEYGYCPVHMPSKVEWMIAKVGAQPPAENVVERPVVDIDHLLNVKTYPRHGSGMMAYYEVDEVNALVAALLQQLERATDLVRHQRHELFEEKVISDEEYAALVTDSDKGERVARLEGYDDTRKQLEEAQRERDEARHQRDEANSAFARAIDNGSEFLKRAEEAEASLKFAGEILGIICVYGTLLKGEKPVEPPPHAAVDAILAQIKRAEAAESKLSAMAGGELPPLNHLPKVNGVLQDHTALRERERQLLSAQAIIAAQGEQIERLEGTKKISLDHASDASEEPRPAYEYERICDMCGGSGVIGRGIMEQKCSECQGSCTIPIPPPSPNYLTPSELNALEELRGKATPGIWEGREVEGNAAIAHPLGWVMEGSFEQNLADSRYIASLHPITVDKMIEEIRASRRGQNPDAHLGAVDA